MYTLSMATPAQLPEYDSCVLVGSKSRSSANESILRIGWEPALRRAMRSSRRERLLVVGIASATEASKSAGRTSMVVAGVLLSSSMVQV